MKDKIMVLFVILLAISGCVSTNTLDLTRYQMMEVKMTSAQGVKEAVGDEEDIDELNELLHQLDLKETSASIENGWQISCTLSNTERSLDVSVLNDHIMIGDRCYQVSRDDDRLRLVSYFDAMFNEKT